MVSQQVVRMMALCLAFADMGLSFTVTSRPASFHKATLVRSRSNYRPGRKGRRFRRTLTLPPPHQSVTDGINNNENELTVTENGVFLVNSMPPPLPRLTNDYYLLRHGQSWGNVENVISSARSLATSERHGLTPLGYEQGMKSAEGLLELISSDLAGYEAGDDTTMTTTTTRMSKRVFLYSSPFARARQTAQACMDGLAEGTNRKKADEIGLELHPEIIIEDGLMERYFGVLDDAPIHTYGYVWPVDMINVTHTEYGVESVAAVATRIRNVLMSIDSAPLHSDQDGRDSIVLVSHADVLQITQLYVAGVDNVGNFSSYRFANGEVRAMRRTPDSLPKPEPLPRLKDA